LITKADTKLDDIFVTSTGTYTVSEGSVPQVQFKDANEIERPIQESVQPASVY
jgi:hypothetical protein